MRSGFIYGWALALIALSCSAAAAETPKPRCGGTLDRCGYVDSRGVTIIGGDFEKADPFSDGLAAVRVEGLWGFVDETGELVIKPRFHAVRAFDGRRASVTVDGKAGIIDRTGAFVIAPQFRWTVPFTDEVALVEEGTADGPVNRSDPLYSPTASLRLYHHRTGWLTPKGLSFQRFARVGDAGTSGLIWASTMDGDRLLGLMNERGEWVIPPRFNHVQQLNDGRAIVVGAGGRWGAVDEAGAVVVPLRYDWLAYFRDGYGLVGGPGNGSSRRMGLIRKDGTVVAEPIYDKAERPEGGRPARVRQGEDWYEVQADGRLARVAADPNGVLAGSCPQGLKIWQKGEKYLPTKDDGRPSVDRDIDYVQFGIVSENGISLSRVLDCRAPIYIAYSGNGKNDDNYTYLRTDGEPLFTPVQYYKAASVFQAGHAVVGTAWWGQGGNWGIIDTGGKFTLPLQNQPLGYHPGASRIHGRPVFSIGVGDTQGFVDATGNRLPEMSAALDRAVRASALACGDGAKIFADGDLFGMVDRDGRVMIAPVHRALSCFRSGVAWAPDANKQEWCPIGQDGQFRTMPACIKTFYPAWISHHAPEKFSENAHENSVLWVRAGLQYGLGQRPTPPGWVGDGVRSRASYSVAPFRP